MNVTLADVLVFTGASALALAICLGIWAEIDHRRRAMKRGPCPHCGFYHLNTDIILDCWDGRRRRGELPDEAA